ncbi:MAG: hypothetical protein ACM3WP_14270 [Acidobacteriota bacterium]
MRHTFLTEASRNTQNVKALQLLAGHANISTTMKYVYPRTKDVLGIAAQVHAARQLPTKVPMRLTDTGRQTGNARI